VNYNDRVSVFPELSYGEDNSKTGIVNIKASEILGVMDKTYQQIHSFRAELDVRSSDNNNESLVRAVVAFRRNPDRAVAFVTYPNPATYLFDGDHVILYPSPDQYHYTRHELLWGKLNGAGIGVIFGRLLDNPKHDILSRVVTTGFKTQTELGDFDRLDLLTPLESDNVLCERIETSTPTSSIVMLIGRKDHLLRRISWTEIDSKGKQHSVVAQYSNIKANLSLSPSIFKFIPPKNVTLGE
jgi:outer membrane lipoprotein-sorting protein